MMMMRYFHLALLSTLLFIKLTLILGDVGTATSYGPPYIPTACDGNRREQFPAGNMFVAVNEGLWDNGAACGRRYKIRCLSGDNRPCKGFDPYIRLHQLRRKPNNYIYVNNAVTINGIIIIEEFKRLICFRENCVIM
ncbi:hypothetical protein AAHE18_08G218100 [Arachis hypogaea]|nr:EG45-like domain containing protein 2 isoform X1 [Arachis hypogaea]